MSDELVLARLVRHLPVPALIADAGDDASRRFLEFFTAKTRNRHTRAAYARRRAVLRVVRAPRRPVRPAATDASPPTSKGTPWRPRA